MSRALVFAVLLAVPPADPDEARREALTRYGLGLLRARTDQPATAAKDLEAAAKADPTSPEPLRPLVQVYADLGRYAAAIRTARKVLELDPADADTAHLLGKLLYDGKKLSDAVTVLKQAADSPRLADRPARRFGVLRDLAQVADAAGDWTGAVAALTTAGQVLADNREKLIGTSMFPTAVDLDREAALLWEKRGEALASLRKSDAAEAAFREAHKRFADPAGANDPVSAARLDWHLSGLLADRGRLDDALAHLDRFLALKPSGPAPYGRLADLYRRLGRGRQVPANLSRLADLNPKNETIRWVLAAEVGRDNPAGGERLFREELAKTADPRFFARYVRFLKEADRFDLLLAVTDDLYKAATPPKADADTNQKPRDPAVELPPPPVDPTAARKAQAITAAVKAEPGLSVGLLRAALDDGRGNGLSPRTWELVAWLAERDGRFDAAARAFRSAVGSGNEELFDQLYRLLYRQRRWEELLTVIREVEQGAGRRNGRSRLYDYDRVTPLAELGRAGESLATADRAIKNVVGAGRINARVHKARALAILGRYADAARECEDIFPECHSPADVHQVRVVLADALNGLKRHADAEAELRKILDDDPDDVLALNNLGYNLADQGRKLDEAEELVRRAIDVDRDERLRAGSPEPENGGYLDSLGWVLFRRGKVKEAREVLEQAVRLPDAAPDAIVWDHLGDACFRLGDRDAARRAWTKAAELYRGSHQGKELGRRDEVLLKLKQVP